jgi:putative membrane protein
MVAQAWTPYCGPAPSPANLLADWNLDLIVGLLGVLAAAMFIRMYRREGFKPGLYAGAIAVFAIAFASPICALSSALFSARVVHHLLLVLVAAPLLVASLPRALLWGGGALSWTVAQAIALWFWHAPAAYEAALSNSTVYWVMQATLVLTAIGFWGAVRRSTGPSAVSALLLAMLPMGMLGALLTFSPVALYAPHALTTASWGMSPEADQQLGGLIMWAPAAGFYLAAALAVFSRTLRRADSPS